MTKRKDIELGLISLLPRLRRFAIGLSGSTDEGDDLVQAACLKALERYSQWQADSRLDSWVYKIIMNIWIDRRRSAEHRLSLPGEGLWEQIPGAPLVAELEARQDLKRTWQAIKQLPEEQRQVLLLVTVEGFGYQEAADMLEIPIGTVMSRLARARIALARLIRDDNPSE
ncbi:RNA polymerase sigma factor [Dongia sp.]|uniref:RNA polymerase sigma factor n=1 Tax=Dongia sp. TaxID=1977262 RepID=UPI0035AF4521